MASIVVSKVRNEYVLSVIVSDFDKGALNDLIFKEYVSTINVVNLENERKNIQLGLGNQLIIHRLLYILENIGIVELNSDEYNYAGLYEYCKNNKIYFSTNFIL